MTQRPTVYEAYQELADHYAKHIDTKPHNAYYERPAMMEMWPDLAGKLVLDAGCGPGVYAECLMQRGAKVISFDISDRMLELARERLGEDADLRLIDMTQPMSMFQEEQFDFINAPLCLDYIEDWRKLFAEFNRVLRPGGCFQFSCGHPSFDAEYYQTEKYFSVEAVQCVWTGFGIDVMVPSYRRSIQELFSPLLETGFQICKVVEPLPTEAFRQADLKRYQNLSHRPGFICVQAEKR